MRITDDEVTRQLPTGNWVTSRPRLLPRAVALLQSGSVLMIFTAPVTRRVMWITGVWAATWSCIWWEGHTATGVMLIWVACAATWGHGDIHT